MSTDRRISLPNRSIAVAQGLFENCSELIHFGSMNADVQLFVGPSSLQINQVDYK
jgi:hypothetical protein